MKRKTLLATSAALTIATASAALLLLLQPVFLAASSKSEHYNLLSRLTRNKDWSRAEAAARRARAEFPGEGGFVRYLTWTLCAQKKFSACAAQTEAGLRRWPRDQGLKSRLYRAHRDHGRALIRKKDYGGAVTALEKAMALGPRSAWIYKLHTNALRRGGMPRRAARAAAAGIKAYPADQYLRVLLAYAYKDALRALQKKGAGAELLPEIEGAIDRSRTLRESRHLFRLTARTHVRKKNQAGLKSFLARMGKTWSGDPYFHHLSAKFLRSLFNRDKRRFKSLYDEATAHRKKAFVLYTRKHTARNSPAGLQFPLRDSFLVINSYGTTYTHFGYNHYCYDFLNSGPGGEMLRPGTDGSRNEDWYGFGGEIRAVLDGKVLYVANHYADLPPGTSRPRDNNTIEIDHGNGVFSVYLHNKRNSARVRRGQKVRKGQVIARVGNSGWTVSPHVHFCIYDKNRFSLPPRFPSARVRETKSGPPRTMGAPFKKSWRLQWSP